VVDALKKKIAQRPFDGASNWRMRVGFKLGACQIRNLARESMQLYDVCIFDIP
jgi:hypothetical protein